MYTPITDCRMSMIQVKILMNRARNLAAERNSKWALSPAPNPKRIWSGPSGGADLPSSDKFRLFSLASTGLSLALASFETKNKKQQEPMEPNVGTICILMLRLVNDSGIDHQSSCMNPACLSCGLRAAACVRIAHHRHHRHRRPPWS